MATNLTEFRVVLPNTDAGTAADSAVQAFLNNINTLCQLELYSSYIRPLNSSALNQQLTVFGLITTAQQSTALGYLNTLNSALGTPVLCTIHSITTEP